ncbi:hypothetical protein [Phytomonospora endophytica]|uniref:Uncharacterized protein n=1 Tax=Phytomonospora endophytica TaxID=714109 RepID=A0A841FQ80_9ACTN|nr:hypothetical protein [Phytomonospora endophytica]MBB6035712.1 hypothetical protein [Phytomonospora endophytica]GIG69611.1 hypothetical protein Pen01_59060 [Phytomonospora endophytica]
MLTETRSPARTTTAAKGTATPPHRHPAVRVAVWLAAAWAIPALAHLLGADVVMLPVIWVATATLMRTGTRLLDRLIPALGLTCGAVMLLGFLTTYWPWGLHPIPMSGTAFTILVAVAVFTGRRPRLPLRPHGTDLVLAVGAVLTTYLAAAPTLATTRLGWTAYAAISGDRLRQFNLFDTIRAIGGYPALNPEAAGPILESSMLPAYPPGMHYVLATIDAYITGGNNPGSALDALQRYHWYVTIGFGLMVLTTAWAARWIAGPQAAGWKRALITSTVVLFVSTGIFSTMVWEGFDAQIVGLAFLAILLAVLARPPKHLGEHIVLAGTLTVAVTYSYTLYAAFAGIAILATVVTQWRRLKARPVLTIALGAFFGLAASMQVLIPYIRGFDGAHHVNATGFIVPMPKVILYACLALAAVAVFTPNLRRSPRLQILAATSVGGLLFAIGLRAYNVAYIGTGSYYYEKVLQALVLILVITAGAALVHVRPPTWWRYATSGRTRGLIASTAAVAFALFITGALPTGTPPAYNGAAHQPGPDTTWISVWGSGQIHSSVSNTLEYLDEHGLTADGVPTQVVFTPNGGNNQHLTLILAMLNRNLGGLYRQVYGVELDGLNGHDPALPLSAESQASLDLYELVVSESTVPLRVLTNDANTAAVLGEFAATNPGAGLTVHYLPDMPGEGPPAHA